MTESEVKAVLAEKGAVAVFAESPDYLVLLKSVGIPSAPLKGGLRSAFEVAAEKYPEIGSVKGKNASEGGLIHRIDNDTAGLLLIARTQHFYDEAVHAQDTGNFLKTYTAYCVNLNQKGKDALFPQKNEAPDPVADTPFFTEHDLPHVLESRFRPLGKKGAVVKPVFENRAGRADRKKAGTVIYRTTITDMKPFSCMERDEETAEKGNADYYRIHCSINAGFRHQVRSHLSAAGYPVAGDRLYGYQETHAERMLFFASGLEIKEAGLSVSIQDDVLDEIALSAISY